MNDPRATAELHTAPIADGPAVVGAYDDDSPQAVTYLESLLEGADPYEGFL